MLVRATSLLYKTSNQWLKTIVMLLESYLASLWVSYLIYKIGRILEHAA